MAVLKSAGRELWRALGVLGEERTYGRRPVCDETTSTPTVA